HLNVSYEQFRHFDQTPSAAAKLAHLILSWCEEAGGQTNGEAHLRLPLTHEGIAHMIGTSRETVTRTFGKFRNRNIIRLEGSKLSIRDKAELESFIKLDSQSPLTH